MTTLGNKEFDNLFAGHAEVVIGSITAGEALTRGDVVGVVTASGKAKKVDSTASDGSQKPYGIITDDVEIEYPVNVYLTGEFNEDALKFGGTDTADTHRIALRDIGIFLKQNIGQ